MNTVIGRDPKTHLATYDFSAYTDIPAAWRESLTAYFNQGTAPGKFLRAVLENDFMGALRRLSPSVHQRPIALLFLISELLVEGAPSAAHGSPEKVAAWLALWEADGIYGRARDYAANSAPKALFEESTYGKDGL